MQIISEECQVDQYILVKHSSEYVGLNKYCYQIYCVDYLISALPGGCLEDVLLYGRRKWVLWTELHRASERWVGGTYGCLGWWSKASEGVTSEMRGFPPPSGAAERALQAVETKWPKTQKLETFHSRQRDGRGLVADRGNAKEVSWDLSLGSPFGLQK